MQYSKKKGRGKKRSKNKRSRVKVFKITPKTKRNKFRINFKSIRHKKTRDFAELAFVKDVLKDLSKTLNKKDYKKLKRRVKKLQRKGSDKKWQGLIKEMKKQNASNNLIPEKVSLRSIRLKRGDGNKSVLSKIMRFALMTTLLMKGTNKTSSNTISALEAYSNEPHPINYPSKAPETELIVQLPKRSVKQVTNLNVLNSNQTNTVPVKISIRDINKHWRKS